MQANGPALIGVLLLAAVCGAVTQKATPSGGLKRLPSRTSRPCRLMQIEGTVEAGKSFRKTFGGGLDVLVEAVPHGWIVRVVPTGGSRPEVDFAELATPPFRSINPLLLTTDFGFRAQDVIGWNPRTFGYLGRASEVPAAERAYRAVLSSSHPTRAEEMAVTQVAAGALEGRFEVLDAVLIPGGADQTPAAGLVATHFGTTAHTVRAAQDGGSGALGKVLSLRFRASLSVPGEAICGGGMNPVHGR